MAKNTAGPDDRAKVKFRFVEFELEGGNAAVENSVKNLAQALVQRNGTTSTSKPLTLKRQTPSLAAVSAEGVEEEEVLAESAVDEEIGSGEETNTASGKPRGPRKYRAPQVVDIDLTSGDMPFKTYAENKILNTDTKKYLACAAWLKEHRNTPAITDDHIYTMFKFMKWPVPGDVGAPLRAMKKQGWFTSSERGKYAINHLGENEVNQMGAAA